uniref:Os08g0442700 protein n=1 Tax=Macrostomum lignano TaxID=282301 RepID=A0A1I8F5M6_9PLAT
TTQRYAASAWPPTASNRIGGGRKLWHHGGAMAGRHQEEGDPPAPDCARTSSCPAALPGAAAPSCPIAGFCPPPTASPTPTCQSPPLWCAQATGNNTAPRSVRARVRCGGPADPARAVHGPAGLRLRHQPAAHQAGQAAATWSSTR